MANKLFHFNGIQAILTDIGLDHQTANTIASASQAVDDFHEDKLIIFENGEPFYPVVTAHRMLDHENLDSRDASNIWMPFHFFPNNNGICEPEPDNDNVQKLIDFVCNYQCETETERQLLHGILLHIYVDTYTHEGFMGLYCKHNDISDLDDIRTWDIGWITGNIPPCIGHGEALSYPDDMWREWSYTSSTNRKVPRNNQDIFRTVTKNIPALMHKLGYQVNDIPDMKKYSDIFAEAGSGDKYEKTITSAFDQITKDRIGQDKDISYQKWKKHVMRKAQSKENKYFRIVPHEEFNTSKWVLFQKLARDIRTFFKREIFPNIRVNTTVY